MVWNMRSRGLMSSDRARLFWVLCVIAGVAVLGFVSWFARAIPAETCTGPPPAGVSSLMLFQLAKTPADLDVVFGPAADPCRAAMVEAMDRANTVDLIGFIETYTLFLGLFFVALYRENVARGAVRIGLAAVGIAATFDAIETATQLLITDSLPPSDLALWALYIGSRVKFIGLAVTCFAAGAAVQARDDGRFARVAGWLCIGGGALVLLGLLIPSARPVLGIGNGVAWLMMLLYAIVAAAGGGRSRVAARG